MFSHWVGWPRDLIQTRGRRFQDDSTRCGQCGIPRRAVTYLVPLKAKGSFSWSLPRSAGLLVSGAKPQTRHCENQSPWRKLYKSCVYLSLPERQTLRKYFLVELRLLTDVYSCFHWHATHLYKHSIQRRTVPMWLPPLTQYIHHNDLVTPTPPSVNTLYIHPWALTTNCYFHYAVVGEPHPGCQSICRPICLSPKSLCDKQVTEWERNVKFIIWMCII